MLFPFALVPSWIDLDHIDFKLFRELLRQRTSFTACEAVVSGIQISGIQMWGDKVVSMHTTTEARFKFTNPHTSLGKRQEMASILASLFLLSVGELCTTVPTPSIMASGISLPHSQEPHSVEKLYLR